MQTTAARVPLAFASSRIHYAWVMVAITFLYAVFSTSALGVPAVLINSPGAGGIKLDNAAGARAVAEQFLALGRKRIVHIAGALGNIDAKERAEAFTKALKGTGAKLEVVQGDFTEASGESAIQSLIKSEATFDAVFAANDMMASGAMQALRRAGLSVPGDVAVAGFDDIPLASHIGLTTVRVRIAELGERALDRLLSLIGGEQQEAAEMHPPELIVRSTTDPQADTL